MAQSQEGPSKLTQVLFTYVLGGMIALYLWPYLDTTCRGLLMLFALLAGVSIQNGTWMQNHRELRRAQRDERRELYSQAYKKLSGKAS